MTYAIPDLKRRSQTHDDLSAASYLLFLLKLTPDDRHQLTYLDEQVSNHQQGPGMPSRSNAMHDPAYPGEVLKEGLQGITVTDAAGKPIRFTGSPNKSAGRSGMTLAGSCAVPSW